MKTINFNIKINILLCFSITFGFLSCSKPSDEIKNSNWTGEIFRKEDDKKLSEIVVKFTNDKLYIYSNAIFGADNDTLDIINFNDIDSTFKVSFSGKNQLLMRFYPKKTETISKLALFGDDFYIVLVKKDYDVHSKFPYAFYKNIKVPRESYMYFDGTYEGDLEMESSAMNLAMGSMFGGNIHLKYVFLEDFKVKQFVKNVMLEVFGGAQKPTIESYVIEGNRMFIGKRDKNTKGFEIKDNGNTLVAQTDNVNIVLKKVY